MQGDRSVPHIGPVGGTGEYLSTFLDVDAHIVKVDIVELGVVVLEVTAGGVADVVAKLSGRTMILDAACGTEPMFGPGVRVVHVTDDVGIVEGRGADGTPAF